MKLICRATCFLCAILFFVTAKAQLYEISLDSKVKKASLIAEGKVVQQHSFWNDEHTMIYTSSTVQLYKLFKGNIVSKQIEVVTQGGTVGNRCVKVSDVLQLKKNDVGMFFCFQNEMNLRSPLTKKILYDVYSSGQGFLRYNVKNNTASAPFAHYKNIAENLYKLIRQKTGAAEKIVDATFKVNAGDVSNGGAGVGSLTSFSPTTVHAGAIGDDANNILTINGSGFSNTPSGSAGVAFKDGNSDNTSPDYTVDYSSPYIISWTDTKIVLHVPDRAATGKIAVILDDGTTIESANSLQVFFAVLDAEFDIGTGTNIISEPRLMNTNSSGGYTFQYSNSTAGNGVDFTTSPAKQTFQRAWTTWKEIAGANLKEGAATTVQKVADDGINVVMFDNSNTTVPRMADGVLESTYSWFSACQTGVQLLTAQKTGFDILIRNDKVSLGSDITFEFGPCFPARGTYDLEMIILHELGHALNLAHINDDYEGDRGNYNTLNPSKVMHYAILDYIDRRSPDAAALQGVLYTITPQGNVYGNCGLFATEMTPLATLAIINDECPSTFPSEAIQDNTSVTFDLVHATSNKFTDPDYTQVNCSNTGTFVTNNAYYAFTTGAETNLLLTVSGYTTVPAELASCSGQGVRASLYDVSACPDAGNYPQPASCLNFSSNADINFTGLQPNHKYLLYFDGLKNTKASFNVLFNSDTTAPPSGNEPVVTVFPNPAISFVNVKIENAAGGTYTYALFDVLGRQVSTGKFSITQAAQIFPVNVNNLAAGIYFLKVADANGKVTMKKKILKEIY